MTISSSSPCILVVEDEGLVARDLQMTLQELGYQVPVTAASGSEALQASRLHAPDVVLMDINLRGPLDGVETARQMGLERSAPVVFLTAFSDDATIARTGAVGPYGFLVKPFDERELVAAIETARSRHAIEEKLRASREQLAATLNSIGDAVLCVDSRGRVLFCNPAAQQLVGLDEETLLGRDFESIVPAPRVSLVRGQAEPEAAFHSSRPSQNLHQLRRDAMQSGQRLEGNGVFQAPDGRIVPVAATFSPLRDKNGDVSGLVMALRDVSERAVWEERLRHQAFHDALTGLPNRILLGNRLEHALRRRGRGGESLAVLFLDLDNFKLVNDSLGHAAGDELLVQVARRLETCLRGGDTIARFGGDEFVVLVEVVDAPSYATLIAARMVELLAQPFPLLGHQIYSTPSIGVAFSERGDESAEELLRYADSAMYQAKRGGKGAFCVYREGLSETSLRRLELGNQLRVALESGQLQLFYQPKILLSQSSIVGFEALLRWKHPEYGSIPPAEFLPIAEENGLIEAISRWVLQRACAQAQAWQNQGLGELSVSVNISPRQFAEEAHLLATAPFSVLNNDLKGADLHGSKPHGLVTDVQLALESSGLRASLLTLEITENALMDDFEGAANIMRQLKTLGVKLAIDDFGAGYSNLAYLRSFPLDFLKLDRRFITGLSQNGDQVIVSSMIHLAHALGLQVVAEGAETAEEVDTLRTLGCDMVQGYFYARPQPPELALQVNWPQ